MHNVKKPTTVLKNAIIDYTLPAVWTPITWYLTTGDMACHQHEEDQTTDIGNMQKTLLKMAHVIPHISTRTDTQTDTDIHTHCNHLQPWMK